MFFGGDVIYLPLHMSGLYIHIPFCKKRCIYCDFFSDTRTGLISRFTGALCREIELRVGELGNTTVSTIYFGGGTPSQLPVERLNDIFSALSGYFDLDSCLEITLEANPDDLTSEYIFALKDSPVNRISMGVQSFRDEDLVFLNRRHDVSGALRAYELCSRAGYDNISIDLIYGLPGQDIRAWNENLRMAVSLSPAHISAYSLIYEEDTALYRLRDTGKIIECDEEAYLQMFGSLIDRLTSAGYDHYEISNFAKNDRYSRHNTSYWQDVPYLGLGPSAHSYDRFSRKWNISGLMSYIENIEKGYTVYDTEIIDDDTRYNDMVITSLRTKWGLDLEAVSSNFGEDRRTYCLNAATRYIEEGLLDYDGRILRLSREGIFVSDGIMSDLLYVL